LPSTADYLFRNNRVRRLRGFPKFLENPFESVLRARDSGGSGRPRMAVNPDAAFDENKSLGIRNA